MQRKVIMLMSTSLYSVKSLFYVKSLFRVTSLYWPQIVTQRLMLNSWWLWQVFAWQSSLYVVPDSGVTHRHDCHIVMHWRRTIRMLSLYGIVYMRTEVVVVALYINLTQRHTCLYTALISSLIINLWIAIRILLTFLQTIVRTFMWDKRWKYLKELSFVTRYSYTTTLFVR